MLKRLRNMAVAPNIEHRTIELNGKHIAYTLKRSNKRRSIGLRIDDSGLTISVPLRSSEKWLSNVLEDKAHWVVEKLDGWQTSSQGETRWADGETIHYLGMTLNLHVVRSLFPTMAVRDDKQLYVFVGSRIEPACIEQDVVRWYQIEANKLFEARVAHYAPLLNVMPSAVKLSSARTQWGSCTAQGVVRLNYQLIKLPLHLIDYVVVHELAHLREMNHSAKFWEVVKTVCHDYVRLRNQLKAIYLGSA